MEVIHSSIISELLELRLQVGGNTANKWLLNLRVVFGVLRHSCSYFSCRFGPIHHGHAEVHENQLIHGLTFSQLTFDAVQCLLAIWSKVCLVPLLLHEQCQTLNIKGAIIYDKNQTCLT